MIIPDGTSGVTRNESSLSQGAKFLNPLGATIQAAIEGHECLRFGGSGSDFAEEPATRVQSRSRRL